ncbi:kinase-like protein [Armillaria gallica]|uniref:Kinase-like protein n=1 Tax=Armillaria gallica TaxID=47427 RepID=A0A2H3E5U3_ARMGA|nr:kinase-like protein [Armillaria gallica]
MHTTGDKRLVAKGIPSRKRLLDADPISVGRVTVTPSTRKRRKLHSSTHTPVLSDTDNLATYTDALVPEPAPLPSALPFTLSLQTTQPQLPDAESTDTTPNSPSPSRSPSPEQMRASFLRNAVRGPGKRKFRRRSSPSFFPPTMAVPERREDDEENVLYPADSYHLRPPYSDSRFDGHSPGPTSLEGGQNTRETNVSTFSSAGDESQKEEAIVDALLDVYKRESGPWHVLDITTDKIAKQVVTALSKSDNQLSDVTAKQAQSTLDFLQDLLHIQGLPLSYKHTFLKTSLKLSRIYDCVPRCIMLRGFKKRGNYPFALGQFGEVWRGEVGGTEVAVKQARIFTNDKDIKEVLQKIRREAIIWGQCDHPNVLPFYGIYRDSAPSSYCLVSPFMVNGSLRQYLSNTANPDRHRLGLDITRGMDYLHKMSIVHGDLKGDNILISDDHRAVIADFGISFVMGATTFGTSSSSRKGGTVRWQAPEVLNGNPNSFSADIYSLACVYFEVFDGSMPWSDLTDGAVIMKVYFHKKRLARPRYLSETDLWWDLMVQCWAHQPSDRPTLQYLMESLHATNDALTPVMKWDKSILTRLRDPLVQGKLAVPSGLPSFLNVEGVSYLSDPDPISVIGS